MKKFLFSLAITTILALPALAAEPVTAKSNPAVLAKVNGVEVTKKEIEAQLANITTEELAGKPVLDNLPTDFQKAFVEKYIEKMLIIDAAKKAGLQNDPEVKQKLKEAEEFLIQQKYLTDLVLKQKSDDKLKKIYDEKLKSKEGKEEANAFHILVKTEDEAKKIREDIVKGANFEKIAESKSIDPGAKVSGGDLGYFTADQMVPEFSKAVFALKKGEISQPIKTQFGWHIVKLIDKRIKKMPTFAETKPALENDLASQLIEEDVKKLKAQAKIEYFGELAKPAAKPAAAPVTKKVNEKAEEKPAAPAAEVKKEEKPATPAPEAKKEEKPATTSNVNKKVEIPAVKDEKAQ